MHIKPFKTFKTEAGARKALKECALHVLPVEFRRTANGRISPLLFTETISDATYVRDRYNFSACKNVDAPAPVTAQMLAQTYAGPLRSIASGLDHTGHSYALLQRLATDLENV